MPGKKAADGKRSHSKGASKGQRWAKGHSCVSNPATTKFRDQASSQFLHPVSDNPLFTVKNVAAFQDEKAVDLMEEDLVSDTGSLSISDISCGTGLSSVSTLRSLSSAWSKCSTNAFDRFLKKFRANSLIHKEMLSILAASSDVIDNAGGKLNDTGFFATFLSFLDSCQPDQYQPVMSLVCIIINRVSPSVLQLKFADIYPKIGTILSFGVENNNDLLMRTAIDALTKLLRVQDNMNLEDDKQLQQIFYTLLKCCLHERPRVRKKARLSVRKLISQQESKNTSLTKLVLGWVLDQLSCFPTCDTKIVADVLSLLLSVWTSVSTISKAGAKKLFEGVLRVMSSGEAPIMKIGFSFFIEVFENFHAITECDPQDELFSKLIVAVWELQTDSRNTECFVLWLRCILSGLVRLRQGPSNFDMSYLSSSLEASTPLWFTSYGKAVAELFKQFFPHLISETISKIVLEKCFRILSKNLLTVPPNVFALQILESLLESMNPALYCSAALDVLLQLIPLRNAQGVQSVMGKFIRAFGVEHIWAAVDPATRWLVVLPLISDNLDGAKLSFWKDEILPGLGTKTKVEVGWAALAGFCRNPQDPENFPAELVGKTIGGNEKLRLPALAALRQFVEWPQCSEMSKKYSKNYLPILFNLYIKAKPSTDDLKGHADAVGVTIQKYLEHSEDEFILELANRALNKLVNEVEEAASPVFDLVAFLSVHVSDKALQEKILDSAVKKWAKLGDSKRCYRIFTCLSKNQKLSADVLNKLFDTLKETSAETKSNAAALRLECITVITEKNPSWLGEFILEAIMNLLSANAKAKRLATAYVSNFLRNLKETGQDHSKVVEIIQVGLSSPITFMVSCTLRFACQVYKDLSPEIPNQLILQRCIDLLQQQTDPVIWKYGMQFLCLNLQLYKGTLGPFASSMGVIISDSKYPRKESTKLLARMIKVFGAVGVRAIVVDSEDSKMRNRIKNICKKLREKKSREDKLEEDDVEEDEEESGDDMDIDVRISNKAPLVMKEGVVDFLSPSDVAKSLINERPPKKIEEFEVDEDGKLIIDVEDARSKRKRQAPEDSDDDEDDDSEYEDDDEDDDLKKLFKNKSSSGSQKSGKSKYSMKSFKSLASSRKSMGKPGSARHGKTNNDRKGKEMGAQRKKLKAKRFKSSSSVRSSKSGKSRKSSAASTYRLKL